MNWMNWVWIGSGLLGSLVVGLVIGRIVAGIKYPNPDKPHIFTPKQSVIILIGVLVAVALIAFAILYQPKPKTDDSLSPGMDDMMDPDGGAADGDLLNDDALPEGDGNMAVVPAA
ncbi:MAG: hypothetical protein PHE47_05795 [Oscillospiraceae bacterium]|nr:hypothetical protein [Oscillospiraceae bacterium]